ncbi:MAG: DciA family protein [Gammaproteobacteria bacterium]
MAKHKLTPISYVRRPGTKYHRLWTHAQLLAELTEYLEKALPSSISGHCMVANLRNTELVIGTDSPVWTARLRYYTPQILKHFTTHPTVIVHRVKIRTLPITNPTAPRPHNRMRISRDSSEILEQTARTVNDSRLQKALLKLAARAK